MDDVRVRVRVRARVVIQRYHMPGMIGERASEDRRM
jgi:hypothetical protein